MEMFIWMSYPLRTPRTRLSMKNEPDDIEYKNEPEDINVVSDLPITISGTKYAQFQWSPTASFVWTHFRIYNIKW